KNYGLPIIVGSRTASAISDKFAVLELDCITVKGKTEPESVYTVLGGADVASSDRLGQLRQNVNDMLPRSPKHDFSAATQAIARRRKFGDGLGPGYLFYLYSERIQIFEETPPPADWNGV